MVDTTGRREDSPGAPPPGSGAGVPAIRLLGVGRRFGHTLAVDAVDLDVRPGEVHAIVGENGAGKSTCLSMLAGRIAPSEGDIRVFGESLPAGDPRASRRAGIAAIYQELTIVPALSTQANVFLGQDIAHRGVISERDMRARFGRLGEELGVSVPPDVPAGSLSVSGQQLVEIMRGVVNEPRIILFDEPTAALAAREREALHEVIRRLQARGVTVVFVSHNLDEVLKLSDTVTVFRGGRLVETRPAARWTKSELVHTMVGRNLAAAVRDAATDVDARGDVALAVRSLRTRRLRDVSFEVRRGEVLGIGGLVGSGRSSLLKALAGDLPDTSGRLWVGGVEVPWPTSVRRARRAGIVLVPEDRKQAGLFHELSARENITIAALGQTSRFGLVSRRRAREQALAASQSMGFDVDRLPDSAGRLSGGNQQKLLLARATICNPTVLLADEPTRGIDVGAKAEIMRTLRRMAAGGTAVVVVSSELEELEMLCDRVVVLAGGEIVGRIDDSERISVSAILRMAFRVEEAA